MTEKNYADMFVSLPVSAKRFARSPWFDAYYTPGIVFGVYSGRLYPFFGDGSDVIEAYWHLRRKSSLFDVPEHPIEISGPEAQRFLDYVLSRDVSRLQIGRAIYAIACNYEGGILMDGVLMRTSDDCYWYTLADGEFVPWLEAQALGFEVALRDPGSWVLQVQGPTSIRVLADLLGGGMPAPFNYFSVSECVIAGELFYVSRTGWTGEVGFELYSRSDTLSGVEIFEHILNVGVAHGLSFQTLESMGIRRIEAGIRDNGTDLDNTLTPFAAGLGQFVDLGKHEFIGRRALELADKGNRFFGITAGYETPIGKYSVSHDGVIVGRLTTAAISPYLQKFIGYVVFQYPEDWVNRKVQLVSANDVTYDARVVELPFYDAAKRIPRGFEKPIV